MEDRGQKVESNSFFISSITDIPESKFSVLGYHQIRTYSWELSGERRKFAEVSYHSISEADKAYNTLNGISIDSQPIRFLLKRAATTLWLTGLPGVVYNRDLFTGLQDLTPGLINVTIPQNPEVPGISCLGIAILIYDTHSHAEDALAILKNPARLYNQNYRVFVNRDIQVMWAEPFFDLNSYLAKETRNVFVSNLPVNASNRLIEEELKCFGQVERMRRYATHAIVTMRTVSDAKALMKSNGLLVAGRRWKIYPAVRINEDPYEPDLYRHLKHQAPRSHPSSSNTNEPVYELSVLQLSTADRQRLYEVIQSSSAFPCNKESFVKGLSVDLLNKARKLLQHSRRPSETVAPKDYLLTHDNKLVAGYEPIKKPRYSDPPRFPETQKRLPEPAVPTRIEPKSSIRYDQRFDAHSSRFSNDSPARFPNEPAHFQTESNPPAYFPYSQQPNVGNQQHVDRNMVQNHPISPEQMQNLTAEQKMHYFYYLNNPGAYYNQYGPY